MRSIFVVGVLILLVSVVSAQYYNVAKINAGTGISVSPASGTGIVTVTATGAAIGDSAIAAWRAWRLYGGATRAIEFHGKYLVNALGGNHTWNIGKPDSAVDTIWTSAVIGATASFVDSIMTTRLYGYGGGELQIGMGGNTKVYITASGDSGVAGGISKRWRVMSDTLRMRSDTTVALIFLRGRADSAWAFKARKGTTTWQNLLWQDTLGNIYVQGTNYLTGNLNILSSGLTTTFGWGSIIFAADKITIDHTGKAIYFTPTGDSGEAGAVAKRDSLYLKKIAKHAFGNAAANLTDTILVAGATATSVIVGGDYLPDGASITYNALRKRVVVDTVFIYRVAITDPDSIGAMTLIK